MQVHMTFKHMDSSDAVKNHAQAKSEKISKYVNGDSYQVDWTFGVEAQVHIADLRIHGPHIDYHSEARTADLYQSIDEALDKIETQLRRHKEKLKDHLHRK